MTCVGGSGHETSSANVGRPGGRDELPVRRGPEHDRTDDGAVERDLQLRSHCPHRS
jgi:hypothetical protein